MTVRVNWDERSACSLTAWAHQARCAASLHSNNRATRQYESHHYSPYERTTWRKLQMKYPEVIEADEIEQIFGSDICIDLYLDVVASKSEWTTHDYSIKTLASYLGFKWRDSEPSGAASIEWYHRWLETEDDKIKQRILEYNEDDCIAMRVLLEGVKKLSVRG